MNDEHFHNIVMIWLLRRLDLGEAKRKVWREYQDLCENDELYELSRDELTVHMLEPRAFARKEDRATLGSDLSASWDFAGSICSLISETDASRSGASVCFPLSLFSLTLTNYVHFWMTE